MRTLRRTMIPWLAMNESSQNCTDTCADCFPRLTPLHVCAVCHVPCFRKSVPAIVNARAVKISELRLKSLRGGLCLASQGNFSHAGDNLPHLEFNVF